jgi:hypothetical protein
MNIQALIDGMNAQWQRERAETQMTHGGLIEALKTMPANAQVANLDNVHSYRGYYRDLAFELLDGTRPAADLLADCKDAMGQVFEGYKGGDYVMGALTPVWVADYGSCGEKLISVLVDGKIVTEPDEG